MTGMTEKEAREIMEESIEMGDTGAVTTVDGVCSRCGTDAAWCDPETDELFCSDHATEQFTGRHG